jgi:membrane-bound lytic murein transglycosylase D
MEMRLSFGLLSIPTRLKESFATRAIANRSLARLDLLRPIIEPELARAGLPVELSGMVQVESGAQTFALSPRGARGLWQLMPDTARRYGLTVTTERDERLDTYRSTRAAARYLRTLYAQFGNWSLVFAAYNAGEQTVQRAIDRSGTTDFIQLSRLLPAETRSYVPAVWASFPQCSEVEGCRIEPAISNNRELYRASLPNPPVE